jgi:predicted TIM-barrel fold metal-dependent hydrolase
MWSQRDYTPETNSPSEMTRLHQALRIKRVVIVTPGNIYGPDNSVTITGMKARGANSRGIASIDENTSDKELDRLEKLGFRGIRKDVRPFFQSDPASARALFEKFARRINRLGWNFEMQTDLKIITGMKDTLEKSPVPIVIDHFGHTRAELGVDQPGFADLLDLIRNGIAYVKISAPYRFSKLAPDYPDFEPLAKALIAANPDRILWGSDWPHPAGSTLPRNAVKEVTPFYPIDDGRVLNLLPTWAPDPKIRRKILVENPARLYRF